MKPWNGESNFFSLFPYSSMASVFLVNNSVFDILHEKKPNAGSWIWLLLNCDVNWVPHTASMLLKYVQGSPPPQTWQLSKYLNFSSQEIMGPEVHTFRKLPSLKNTAKRLNVVRHLTCWLFSSGHFYMHINWEPPCSNKLPILNNGTGA